MVQREVDVRIRAKLPRWYPVFLRACWLAGHLGWKPSDSTASRIASWVARRSDVEVLPTDPDKSTAGLDGLP